MMGRGHFGILLQGVIVLIHQLTTQLVGILGRGLPEERGQIIIIWSLATALEVDEINLSRTLRGGGHHHIPCLEVTVEEALFITTSGEVLGQQTEVCLKFQLVEIKLSSFQETILEIVQVEKHRVGIKLRLGIAMREVEPAGTSQLDVRQLADGALQQLLFLQGVASARLTSSSDGIEQGHRAQVGLQITCLIAAHSQHLRNRQLTQSKMARQIDKGVVLITAGADTSHHRLPLFVRHSVIHTITACTWQLLHGSRLTTLPFFI